MTLIFKNAIGFESIFILCLTIILIPSCKKKEERDLIKNYIGKYSTIKTSTSCCDSNWHIITNQETIEVEVKKSLKGIKIKGVSIFDNFDVNYKDSTFSADAKHTQEYAIGKFFPNDSINLYISISSKVPNNISYRMKKI